MVESKTGIIYFVLIFMIFIAFVGSMIASNTLLTLSDSDTISTVPVNISLSGNDARSIISVSNGTVTLDASNYTFFEEDNIVQIDDNASVEGGLTLTVSYLDASDSYVDNNAVRLVLALIIIFVAIGIIMKAFPSKSR